MSRALRLLPALFVAVSILGACFGGGGSGTTYPLETGDYELSAWTSTNDECEIFGGVNYDGLVTSIYVSGSNVELFGIRGTRTGNTVRAEYQEEYDWSPDYDCLENDTVTIAGRVTGTNQLDVDYRVLWERISGSECTVANGFPLPCTSRATFTLEMVGDGPGPTPSPTATPNYLTRCQTLWADVGLGSTYNFYIIDMPYESWFTGTKTFDAIDNYGFYFVGYDFATGAYQSLGLATSGTYSVTASGTDTGDSLSIQDPTSQLYLDYDTPGAVLGSGGTGSFSGEWSDPYGSDVVPGTGTITVMHLGTAMTFGNYLSYALCYE